MKTNDPQLTEQAKTAILALSVLAFTVIIISSHRAAVIGFSAAALLTISFCLHPHYFRSRRGSLTPAFCLLAFVWFCATIPTLLSFFGGH
jgi:uncharacterized membrane protein